MNKTKRKLSESEDNINRSFTKMDISTRSTSPKTKKRHKIVSIDQSVSFFY